jgi:hypothetical protein
MKPNSGMYCAVQHTAYCLAVHTCCCPLQLLVAAIIGTCSIHQLLILFKPLACSCCWRSSTPTSCAARNASHQAQNSASSWTGAARVSSTAIASILWSLRNYRTTAHQAADACPAAGHAEAFCAQQLQQHRTKRQKLESSS